MTQLRYLILLFAILFYTFGAAAAQDNLTPEQLINRYEFGELRWAPSGQRLAVVVTEPVSADGQATNIWLYETGSEQIRQITWNGTSHRQPRWSPDGNSLAFLASRDEGAAQVHVMPMSGGEAQRVKLAKELAKRATGRTLYILDEPTTGLHFDDVRKLLEVLHTLVDSGNTVLLIEHNMDIIKTADWIIDLGPGAGDQGGRLIATGTPEQLTDEPASHTGRYLQRVLDLAREPVPEPAAVGD